LATKSAIRNLNGFRWREAKLFPSRGVKLPCLSARSQLFVDAHHEGGPLCQLACRRLAFGYHEDRTPTHGYEPTREAAMAAFAKSWRRE
jgi:hypothetical protein